MDYRFQQLRAWLVGGESTEATDAAIQTASQPASEGLLNTSSWLAGRAFSPPESASSDASFRRYFRIRAQTNTPSVDCTLPKSFIVMDAPPEHEDCAPFIAVSESLQQMGLKVPQVLEKNLAQGFLLLTDLGTTTYLQKLQILQAQQGSFAEQEIDTLYRGALSALAGLQKNTQQTRAHESLPPYNQALLATEMNLFVDWLCQAYLQLDGLSTLDWRHSQEVLIQSALAQPMTYVHRDYHSRNLMFDGLGEPGVLDFQDAVHGPLTYDAVSLLRDCYIAWPEQQVTEWQKIYFYELCSAGICQKSEWQAFVKAMDLMGIQRHLKAAGIFARLFLRDGKAGYLPDIPQTLQYIVTVGAKYPELKALTYFVESQVQPAFAQQFAGEKK